MSKKDVVFTVGLCIFMGVLWVVGEIVMGLWLAVTTAIHIVWFAVIVFVTLAVSVWHSMLEDESERTNPKIEKYKRKTQKRK